MIWLTFLYYCEIQSSEVCNFALMWFAAFPCQFAFAKCIEPYGHENMVLLWYILSLYYGIMNPTLQWRIWPRAKIVSTKWIPHAPRYKMVMLIPSSYIGQQPPWASSSMQHPLKVSVQRRPISTARMYARNRLVKKSLWLFVFNQPCLPASFPVTQHAIPDKSII